MTSLPHGAAHARCSLLYLKKLQTSILKVDVDQANALAAQYGVMGVPTMIVFKDGQIANKAVGYKNEAGVEAMLG